MKKIRLNVDALAVESFQTAAEMPATGTVRGHSDPGDWLTVCGGTKCLVDNSEPTHCEKDTDGCSRVFNTCQNQGCTVSTDIDFCTCIAGCG